MGGRLGQTTKAFVDKTHWGWMAKPLPLLRSPIHRWFVFPHSYSHSLVEKIISAWGLTPKDRILDPFAGAGTTLVVAKKRRIPAVGLDLSPLAILATNAKLVDCSAEELEDTWKSLLESIPKQLPTVERPHARILDRAFGITAWAWVSTLHQSIRALRPHPARDVLRLALLRTMREVCAAKSDGGWIRWSRRPSGQRFSTLMQQLVATMIRDLRGSATAGARAAKCYARLGDARTPPRPIGTFSAVICSPPYPNRHDYTRVFAPELLLECVDEEGLRSLRYKLFRSHVEAKGPESINPPFLKPRPLALTLSRLAAAPTTDRRVLPMVRGYFEDVHLLLSGLQPLLRSGAKLAFVVGNVRHAGVMIEVDRILPLIASKLGYGHTGTWLIRSRGNSAQQMEKFGREAARESVVFLERRRRLPGRPPAKSHAGGEVDGGRQRKAAGSSQVGSMTGMMGSTAKTGGRGRSLLSCRRGARREERRST